MVERKGVFKFHDHDVTVLGEDLQVGSPAPEFTVLGQDWTPLTMLAETRGKVRVIAAVPSLDSAVCDRETRRFNEAAAALSKDIVIIVISTDLPYTQKRWCGAAGIEQVTVVSDRPDGDFGKKYGVFLKEVGIFRRAVFVVGRNDKVKYVAYMAKNADEPEYNVVLEAAKEAL
jgi:thiol peroxidase